MTELRYTVVDGITQPTGLYDPNEQGTAAINSFPEANCGAFGDLETMSLTPLLQWSFASGINSQIVTTEVANSATVDSTGGMLRLQSGTNAAGSAIAQSARPASYRPGQGSTLRATPFWVTGRASCTQYFGYGNAVDGYFFGFNGTAFGILIRKGSVDTWVPQGSWNGDECDGTGASGFNWDKTKGVPVMIKTPYLGHGNCTFWVQNPITSAWILCHTLRYANSSTTPQVSNPHLSLYGQVLNSGNTTNAIMYVTCASMFMDGDKAYLGPQWGTDSLKTSVSTEINILTLRSATTYNGVPNRGLLRLRSLSFTSDGGNGIGRLRIKKGVTLGGSPSYTPINGSTANNGVTLTSANSTISVDTAGTTVTGGTYIFNTNCGRNSNAFLDMTPFDVFLAPGETMTFSALGQAASTDISVAINWQEDVQ